MLLPWCQITRHKLCFYYTCKCGRYFKKICDNIKNKKYNNARTVPKSNRQIVERVTIDSLTTQIHDGLLSNLGIGISIKSGVTNDIYGPKTPLKVK